MAIDKNEEDMKKPMIVYGLANFFVVFVSMMIGGEVLKVLHVGDGWIPALTLSALSGLISVIVTRTLLR